VLSHEGMLLDADGYPVDAVKYVTFQLYEVDSGGTAIWWETHQVSAVSGYYQVFLGGTDALDSSASLSLSLFDKTDLWLGVTVGDALDVDNKAVGTELTPRQRFASVPFAIRAHVALDAVGDIHPSSVTTSQITATNVTITDGGTLTLADGALLSGFLPADTIGTNQIANGSITLDDLSDELKTTLQGWCGTGIGSGGCGIGSGSTDEAVSCEPGYIMVPESTLPDGTNVPAFCVMKYEAKTLFWTQQSVSIPFGQPITLHYSIDFGGCRCGAGKGLISEEQWLSIAHNVVNVAANWTGGEVGNGMVYRGNCDAGFREASWDDTEGYYGTGHSPEDGVGNGAENRRTLVLSNGEVIWDLAGNMYEMVNAHMDRLAGSNKWISYNSDDGTGQVATNVPVAKLPPNGWNADQGMGRYYDERYSGTYVVMRGGPHGDCANTGVFTLVGHKDNRGIYAACRCVYTPVGAPQNLAATGGVGQVVLSWEAPTLTGSAAATGYKVYRGTVPNPSTLVATLGDVLTWTDTNVVAGVTYHYRVKAVAADGSESSYSTDASATPTS